jgi:hypothetical protein
LYLAAILYLGYHGNGHYFEFVQPPKAATYRWFAMAAILNAKWPPKYKNPPI